MAGALVNDRVAMGNFKKSSEEESLKTYSTEELRWIDSSEHAEEFRISSETLAYVRSMCSVNGGVNERITMDIAS